MDGAVGTVERVSALVDALLDPGVFADLGALDLVGVAKSLESVARRLSAVGHAVIGGLERESAFAVTGCPSTAAVLTTVLHIDAFEATARVRAAQALGPRHAITGEPLEPVFPLVAAAQAAGTISARHARVITRCIQQLPSRIRGDVAGTVEATLVEHATGMTPRQVTALGVRVTDLLDPDGPAPADADDPLRNELHLRMRRDGRMHIEGNLDPETAVLLATLIDRLSAPTPSTLHPHPDGEDASAASDVPGSETDDEEDTDSDGGGSDHGGTDQPDTDDDGDAGGSGEVGGDPGNGNDPVAGAGIVLPDMRSAARRRHDALTEILRRALAHPGGPGRTPVATTVLFILGPDAATGRGWAHTAFGDLIPARTAHRMITGPGRTDLVATRLNLHGGIMSYGRTRRLACPDQTLALIARDRGCSFPGCDRPPSWSQAHHVIAWADGGPTDLDQMTLLCGHHHRTFQEQGWTCTITHGRAWWTPPPWLDPTQKPRLNHTHHLTG